MITRSTLAAVSLVSGAAIAYEILLMRILSIVQWHHFAWMIISLALLGYGASGTAIALARERLVPRFEQMFAVSSLVFSIAMLSCLALGQRVPFNALEVIWDPTQWFYLAVLYLLFMLPFLFAAACIGLAFTSRPARADRTYFFDLAGAGAGAALAIGALFILQPQQAVIACAACALAASFLVALRVRHRAMLLTLQGAWLLGLLFAAATDRPVLRISEFKGLNQALEVVGARTLAERNGPLGMLSVVESPTVPFRHAPGLSINTRYLPPEQLAVFTDGDGISALTRYDPEAGTPAYLGDVTAALPYYLLAGRASGLPAQAPQVLVLGAGVGNDVLLALHHGAAHIDAVELNAQATGLVRGEFADYAGHLYENERVSLHIAEARGFVSRKQSRYDLIHVALLDSMGAAGAGVQALSESYLYTVEALQQYLARLEPGGLLAVTRWLKLPPRDSLKLAATAILALQESGVAVPGRRLAVIRSWNTVTLLVRNGDFGATEIEAIREFARQRSFDVAWYPEMPATEANRYNHLERPWLYEGITSMLSDGASTYQRNYKYDIEPTTDDRPYFFNFFRWRTLPEVLALRERGGAGLLEWGYPLLAATLVQAAVAGSLLILLPLAVSGGRRPHGQGRRLGGYFFLLGLAFLFIEMAFIQKFILFLSHPLYSVAVVLAGFLVFAGLGSLASARLAPRFGDRPQHAIGLAVSGIAALVLVYLLALPLLFERLIGLGDVARIVLSLSLIAPLAFCMGMPFPLGLKWVGTRAPGFVPWAWGINGFASVLGAALATLLAIEFGFTVVLLAALTLYAAAALLFRSCQ